MMPDPVRALTARQPTQTNASGVGAVAPFNPLPQAPSTNASDTRTRPGRTTAGFSIVYRCHP